MTKDTDQARRLLEFARGDWLPGTWTVEARRFLPSLLFSVYIAHREGKRLSKKELSALMNADVASSGPKYIRLAEDAGLITIEKKSIADRRKDFIAPTSQLIEAVERELARLNEDTNNLTSKFELRVYEKPEDLESDNAETSRVMELFLHKAGEKQDIFRNLHVALSGEFNFTSGQAKVASLDKRWGFVPTDSRSSKSALDKLRALFVPTSSIVKLFPGTAHLMHRDGLHPDDLQAAHAVADILLRSFENVELISGLFSSTSFEGSLILFGGAESNFLTRFVFEELHAEDKSRAFLGVKNPAFDLRFVPTPATTLPEVSISSKGFEAQWGLRDTETKQILKPQLDAKGRLVTDLFLITVLPNFLTPQAYENGDRLIILSGVHGVGTLASSLLWQDDDLMQSLFDAYGTASAWQVVIEVNGIRYSNTRPKPVSLNPNFRGARLSVEADLHERFINDRSSIKRAG